MRLLAMKTRVRYLRRGQWKAGNRRQDRVELEGLNAPGTAEEAQLCHLLTASYWTKPLSHLC